MGFTKRVVLACLGVRNVPVSPLKHVAQDMPKRPDMRSRRAGAAGETHGRGEAFAGPEHLRTERDMSRLCAVSGGRKAKETNRAIISNLIAMASNLPVMGLQPTSDGLQLKSDGLQPNSDGLQPDRTLALFVPKSVNLSESSLHN